jgi:hypothetical protein
MTGQPQSVNESEFYMWRAVFAFALVDNVLSIEEQRLLKSYYISIPLSVAQKAILKKDFMKPQDIEALYAKITDPAHRERFCALARALVWCEGNMDRQEEEILRRVSCLKDKAYDGVLRKSRSHPHLHDYYKSYARAGVAGLLRPGPGTRISA